MAYPVWKDPLTLVKVVNIPVEKGHPSNDISDVSAPSDDTVIRLVFGSGSMRKCVDVKKADIPRMSAVIEKSIGGLWLESNTRTFYIHSELPCSTTFLMFLQCMGSYDHEFATPDVWQAAEWERYGRTPAQRIVCLATAVATMADYLLCPKAKWIINACYQKVDCTLKVKNGLLDTQSLEDLQLMTAGVEELERFWKYGIADCVQSFCKWYFWGGWLTHERPAFMHQRLFDKSAAFKGSLCEMSMACAKQALGSGNKYAKDPNTGASFNIAL